MKLKRHIRNRLILGATILLLSVGVYTYATAPTYELITYETTVSKGDNLWDICAEIVSNNEDIREVMDRAIRDNHLDKNGRIYEGMRLIIRVKEVNQ